MLKDEVKTSRGCRLQERMWRRKGGEGVTPLEAVQGQATGGCWTQRGGILRSPSCPGPRAEEGRVCSNGARCGPCDVGCRWHGHSGGGRAYNCCQKELVRSWEGTGKKDR